jgi:hypothetical protein
MCNVSVHQSCYDLKSIPEGDWICDVCVAFGENGKYLSCPFCSCRGGVLRQSKVLVNSEFMKKMNSNYFDSLIHRTLKDKIVRVETACTTKNEISTRPIFYVHRKSKINYDDDSSEKSSFQFPLNTCITSFKFVVFRPPEPESLIDTPLKSIEHDQQILKLNISDSESPQTNMPEDVRFVSEMSDMKLTQQYLLNPDFGHLSEYSEFLNSENFNLVSERIASQYTEQQLKYVGRDSLFAPSIDPPEPNSLSFPSISSEFQPRELVEKDGTNSVGIESQKLDPKTRVESSQNSLLYNYYTQQFKFDQEELRQKESIPKHSWIHLCCLFWIPELVIDNSIDNLSAEKLSIVKSERFNLSCIICRTSHGAAVGCAESTCQNFFHPECARRARLKLEIVSNKRNMGETSFLIFCPKHTSLNFKGNLKKSDQKNIDEIEKFHRYFKRFFKNRKIQTEKASPTSSPVKPKKLIRQPEHLVKNLQYEQKYFLRCLKEETETDTEFTFHVNLRHKPHQKEYHIKSINIPERTFYAGYLPRALEVWDRVADSLQITSNSAYYRFQKFSDELSNAEEKIALNQMPLSRFREIVNTDALQDPSMAHTRSKKEKNDNNSCLTCKTGGINKVSINSDTEYHLQCKKCMLLADLDIAKVLQRYDGSDVLIKRAESLKEKYAETTIKLNSRVKGYRMNASLPINDLNQIDLFLLNSQLRSFTSPLYPNDISSNDQIVLGDHNREKRLSKDNSQPEEPHSYNADPVIKMVPMGNKFLIKLQKVMSRVDSPDYNLEDEILD